MRAEPAGVPKAVVLLANDQEWTLRTLESVLAAEGCRIERVYTGRQALKAARRVQPDLAILDLQLPDLSGIDVCRSLRADPAFGAAFPMIITTASSMGRYREVEAVEAGAWGFFVQPLDGPLLMARVRTFLAARRAYEQVRRHGLTDGDPRLYNTYGIVRRLREMARDLERQGRPFCCVTVSPADPALSDAVELVERHATRLRSALRDTVRASDTIGHLRGCDFVILAPDTNADAAMRIVDRVERAYADQDSGTCRLTAGIAAMTDAPADADPAELLSRAIGAQHPAQTGTVL